MEPPLPIQQQDRTVIVDVLRGFALFGVLLGNFSGMITNNVPGAIISAKANGLDRFLNELHEVLIENKFMTLFSILFGYGFGVIMQRLEKKNIHATSFFLRRMFWLFTFGCINLAVWNGDILHIYAVAGLFLLFFRKLSNRTVIISSILFLFVIPLLIRLYQQFLMHYSIDSNLLIQNYYQAYKSGSLTDVIIVNYKTYPLQWIFSWIEWRDLSETLGRFLLGYYILRKQILLKPAENIGLINKTAKWSFAVMVVYMIVLILFDRKIIQLPRFYLYSFFKIGILASTLFYSSVLIQIYRKQKLQRLTSIMSNLGRMTLTNYLVQTVFYVVLFYSVGFGMLGEISFTVVWICSLIIYFLQGLFSDWWLSKFYYGPVEWIWRQLSYRKRFRLRKDQPLAALAKDELIQQS